MDEKSIPAASQNKGNTSRSHKIIPNSFQTPNFYVDDYLHLLTPEETCVLLYTVRRTLGFQGRSEDQISLAQYARGKKIHGQHVDHGTGLSINTVKNALGSLIRYGLILEVHPANPAACTAATYALQLDRGLVDYAGLEQRKQQQNAANRHRARKSSRTRARLRDSHSPQSPHDPTPPSPDDKLSQSPHDPTPPSPDDLSPPHPVTAPLSPDAMHDHGIRKPEETQRKTIAGGDCDSQPSPERTVDETPQKPPLRTQAATTQLKHAITDHVTGQGWRLNSTGAANIFPELVEMSVSPVEACAAIDHARVLERGKRCVYWLRDLPNDVRTYRNRKHMEEANGYRPIHASENARNGTRHATDSPNHRTDGCEAQGTLEERKRHALEHFERKQANRC